MSKRTETRTDTSTYEVTFTMCDICKKEVGPERSIQPYTVEMFNKNLNRHQAWWRKPFDKIVGIRAKSTYDEYNSDFDVHVSCAYDAIKTQVKANK